jgi:nitric oxide dioxygenase
MHDTLKEDDVISVSHPRGDFFLNPSHDEDTPLVLISGGVGLTPLLSMLNSLVTKNSNRPVTWIHGARSKNERAFTEHIKKVEASSENVKVVLFNAEPSEGEVHGEDYHHGGYVDLNKLDQSILFLGDQRTQYYAVGPVPFMVGMEKSLDVLGVPASRVNVERFGVGGVPAA